MITIQLKFKPERFVMHLPDLDIFKVENLALKQGCTKSWIIRSILVALEKKYPTKQLSFKIDDKCPKNVLEPSKQLSGTLVSLKRFKTFTMDERRKAISDKLRKI